MPRKKQSAPASNPPLRPTTRTIAAEARVSSATVSLALRNSPLLSAETRTRIRELALRLGYRPDPEVAKLMHHLRQRHKPRFKSVIVGLTTTPASENNDYAMRIWKGILRQSDALGYGASLQHIQEADLRKDGFCRTLGNRGVEGIVFLPQAKPIALENSSAWDRFSIVAATHSIFSPVFHRIVPDQFGNTLLICQKLEQMGKRRIGQLLKRQSDITVDHRISGAIAWQNTLGATEPTLPLLYDDDYGGSIKTWFRKQRPDAIIVGTEEHARRVVKLLGLSVPGPVLFAIADNNAQGIFPGIDQCAEEVGASAVMALCGQLQSGSRGIPAHPCYTMIRGTWHPGADL